MPSGKTKMKLVNPMEHNEYSLLGPLISTPSTPKTSSNSNRMRDMPSNTVFSMTVFEPNKFSIQPAIPIVKSINSYTLPHWTIHDSPNSPLASFVQPKTNITYIKWITEQPSRTHLESLKDFKFALRLASPHFFHRI